MKIRSIIATETHVPMRKGYVDSDIHGDASWTHLSKWILEIQFDNGIVGLGESPRGVTWPEIKQFSDFLLGKRLDEIQLQRIFLPQEATSDFVAVQGSQVEIRRWEYDYPKTFCYFGFECALLDAWGKVSGLPVSGVLGGAYRDRVPVSFWFGRMLPEDGARQAALAKKLGFTALKMKASIQDDLPALVKAVREVTGDPFPLVIDPNRRFYRLEEALRMARKLDRFEDIWYEDPFPYQKDEWQEFRRETKRPLVWHTGDPVTAALEHACDYVNIGAFSIYETRFQAEIAAKFNLLHWQGTGLELGILDVYRIHSSAASRTCVLSGDTIGHRIREDDLIVEELKVENGHILVPKGAGLGVTLDSDAMKRYQLRQETIQS